MSIWRTEFDHLSEADLDSLIDAGTPEGLTVEYKRDPYPLSHEGRQEALKDITAFANSAGGQLIIGLKDENGAPTDKPGIAADSIDALKQRLESLAQACVEPRVVGIRMKAIPLRNGRSVLVIRVPKSWNPPHAVRKETRRRYYIQNSAGVHEASVQELRVLFTLSANAQEQVRGFRAARLEVIAANQGPVGLHGRSRAVLHLVPLSALSMASQIDLAEAYARRDDFSPMLNYECRSRHNLDGVLNHVVSNDCEAYTQAFRNGAIKAVCSNIIEKRTAGSVFPAHSPRRIKWVTMKKSIYPIARSISRYLHTMNTLGIATPIICMTTFQAIAGARLEVVGDYDQMEGVEPFSYNHDPIILPEAVIDDYPPSEACAQILRPAFDATMERGGAGWLYLLRSRWKMEPAQAVTHRHTTHLLAFSELNMGVGSSGAAGVTVILRQPESRCCSGCGPGLVSGWGPFRRGPAALRGARPT